MTKEERKSFVPRSEMEKEMLQFISSGIDTSEKMMVHIINEKNMMNPADPIVSSPAAGASLLNICKYKQMEAAFSVYEHSPYSKKDSGMTYKDIYGERQTVTSDKKEEFMKNSEYSFILKTSEAINNGTIEYKIKENEERLKNNSPGNTKEETGISQSTQESVYETAQDAERILSQINKRIENESLQNPFRYEHIEDVDTFKTVLSTC
jgi:hypothetical protein